MAYAVFDVVAAAQSAGLDSSNVQALSFFLITYTPDDPMLEPALTQQQIDNLVEAYHSILDFVVSDYVDELFPGKVAASMTEEERLQLLRHMDEADWYVLLNLLNDATYGNGISLAVEFNTGILHDPIFGDYPLDPAAQGYPLIMYSMTDGDGGIWDDLTLVKYGSPIECDLPATTRVLGAPFIVDASYLPTLKAKGYTHTGWINSLTGDPIVAGDSLVPPYRFYAAWEEGDPPEEGGEVISTGKKFLLYRMFPPYIARALSER